MSIEHARYRKLESEPEGGLYQQICPICFIDVSGETHKVSIFLIWLYFYGGFVSSASLT
jgi:hypothetical protein